MEYERVAYPYTIREVVEKCKRDKLAKEEATRIRQAGLAEKLKNLDKWTRDLNEKIRKKEAEATAAKVCWFNVFSLLYTASNGNCYRLVLGVLNLQNFF